MDFNGNKGPSIESVLDRLPTAEVLRETEGMYEVQVKYMGMELMEM